MHWLTSDDGNRLSLVSDGRLLARISKDRDGWFLMRHGQRVPVPSAELERVKAELFHEGEQQAQRAAISKR